MREWTGIARILLPKAYGYGVIMYNMALPVIRSLLPIAETIASFMPQEWSLYSRDDALKLSSYCLDSEAPMFRPRGVAYGGVIHV